MNVTSLIILSITVMLFLACGIIFFVVLYQRRVIRHQQEIKRINEQKQQELINASLQGEEQERMRIASELHDDVGATLSSVRLFLHAAARQPEDGSIIDQSRELLDDSIQKIRNISHKLQPSTLEHLGLHVSLQSHADMLSKSGNVLFSYTADADLPRLDENTELSVFRIVQELTNNIVKHAGATVIHLAAHCGQSSLELLMTHNGEGLTMEAYQQLIYKKGAIGLKNIVNRLKSINALIHFEKHPDHYSVRITVSLNS